MSAEDDTDGGPQHMPSQRSREVDWATELWPHNTHTYTNSFEDKKLLQTTIVRFIAVTHFTDMEKARGEVCKHWDNTRLLHHET